MLRIIVEVDPFDETTTPRRVAGLLDALYIEAGADRGLSFELELRGDPDDVVDTIQALDPMTKVQIHTPIS